MKFIAFSFLGFNHRMAGINDSCDVACFIVVLMTVNLVPPLIGQFHVTSVPKKDVRNIRSAARDRPHFTTISNEKQPSSFLFLVNM